MTQRRDNTPTFGTEYPPEPWQLRGALLGSAWLVPRSQLPGAAPEGTTPIVLGKRALVFAAWAIYTSEGMLSYNELLLAVAVRAKLRAAVHIPLIWVDSLTSVAGGRELWGIPKELGSFRIQAQAAFEAEASTRDAHIASFNFTAGRPSLGGRRIALHAAQLLAGQLKLTPMHAHAHCRLGRATWRFNTAGPLGFLHGRKPLFSLQCDGLSLQVGA